MHNANASINNTQHQVSPTIGGDDCNTPFTNADLYGPSYWEIFADHYRQSQERPQYHGESTHQWCPAYWAQDGEGRTGRKELVASLLVFDLIGSNASAVLDWLFCNMLTGITHPIKSTAHQTPARRVILPLNRPVTERTYSVLWTRIAKEVFGGQPNLAHADFRLQLDFAGTVAGKSDLIRHDANPLNVDGALSLATLSGRALGRVSDVDAQLCWPDDL